MPKATGPNLIIQISAVLWSQKTTTTTKVMFIADLQSQAKQRPRATRHTALTKEGPRSTPSVCPSGHPRCLEAPSVPALAPRGQPRSGSRTPGAPARPPQRGRSRREMEADGNPLALRTPAACSPRTHGNPRTHANPSTSVQTHPHTPHIHAPCKPVNYSRTTHARASQTPVRTHEPPRKLTHHAHPGTTPVQTHSPCTLVHTRENPRTLMHNTHGRAHARVPTHTGAPRRPVHAHAHGRTTHSRTQPRTTHPTAPRRPVHCRAPRRPAGHHAPTRAPHARPSPRGGRGGGVGGGGGRRR